MCLGVPGKIVSINQDATDMALVDVCGVKREVNIALVAGEQPAALIDQWVLVHVGFAMSVLDEDEALATLHALEKMNALEHELADFSGLANQTQ